MKLVKVLFVLSLVGLLFVACSANTGQLVTPGAQPPTAQREQKLTQPAATSVSVASVTPSATSSSPVVAPTKVSTPSQAATMPKSPEVYKLGDTIKVKDHTISVLSVNREANKLTAEILINNTGSKEISVSSMISFEAKTVNGERLGFAMPSNGSTLDGKVLPGDKLKGVIAYKLATEAKGLKLYYTPSVFGEGAIVIGLDEDALKSPFPKPMEVSDTKAFSKGTVYKVGDAIANKNVIAKLVSAKLEGGVLNAAFLIYNGGQKDVSISSMVSFDAKDGDGNKGKYKFLATEEPGLDGKLVAGDALRGSMSWEFQPSAKDIKIYYTDSIFMGDTIVWSVP